MTKIYQWLGGRWLEQARILVANAGESANHGEIDPSAPITVSSLTGGNFPDFLIHTYGADTYWLNVISHVNGKWTAIPFNDADGQTLGENEVGITAATVIAGYNNCSPSCANGHVTRVSFHYTRAGFIPVGSPGSCAGEALARAAHKGFQNATIGSSEILSFSCANGYAMAIADSGGEQTIIFRFTGGKWKEIANTSGGPQGSIPPYVFRKIYNKLGGEPQNLSYPY